MCIEFQHLSCYVVVIKGLVYLLTYSIAVVIAAVASKLKYLINFGIYWKNLLSHSRPWVCGLGVACLWPWLASLDTSGLVSIPDIQLPWFQLVTEFSSCLVAAS